jgi:hypothetical protein
MTLLFTDLEQIAGDGEHVGCATCTSESRQVDLKDRYPVLERDVWVCMDCASEIEMLRGIKHRREPAREQGELWDQREIMLVQSSIG